MSDLLPKGLYHKFDVRRTDATDGPGGKHEGCDYFVLDLTCDRFALGALWHYAQECRAQYPELARDLEAKCESHLRDRLARVGL